MSTPRGKFWEYTISIKEFKDEKNIEICNDFLKNKFLGIKFLKHQREIAESDNDHMQGVVMFSNIQRSTVFSKIMFKELNVYPKFVAATEFKDKYEYVNELKTRASDESLNLQIGNIEVTETKSVGAKRKWNECKLKANQIRIEILQKCDENGEHQTFSEVIDKALKGDDDMVEAWQGLDKTKKMRLQMQQIKTQQMMIEKYENDDWYSWQELLREELDDEIIDPRKIIFVIEPNGNTGKTYFTSRYRAMNPDTTFMTTLGKSADVAYNASQMLTRRVVLIDKSRTNCKYLPFGIIEHLKNGTFTNTKYESRTIIGLAPHMVMFSNHVINFSAMSWDRWEMWVIHDKEEEHIRFKWDIIKKVFETMELQKLLNEKMNDTGEITRTILNKCLHYYGPKKINFF